MSRPHAVIVGAGLGGCMLAHALLESHDVTVIERGTAAPDLGFPFEDVGRPAGMDPHFAAGLGGSTQLWHNGLIEIDPEVFDAFWPMAKSELGRYYDQAFQLLAGGSRAPVQAAIADLRSRYERLGLAAARLPALYYPRWPANLWQSLKLAGRVRVVQGEVTGFELGKEGALSALRVSGGDAGQRVCGDVYVLAAGGLDTPLLLQRLAVQLPALRALQHAGRHYEDHPMGFVGELQLSVPMYQLWNHHVKATDGNLRLPFVTTVRGMQVSFQLRPAATYYRASRRQRTGTVLNELRRNPWNPLNYLRLLNHWDDVLDILSFKFNIHLPTKHYTLLLMAQMPASDALSIWGEPGTDGQARRLRRWHLDDEYLKDLDAAVDQVLAELGPMLKSSRRFPSWQEELRTGAHHSGTARMSASAADGVCNTDCLVHGMSNLYVCDGAVIPASGIANTGLTIGALALRLADHLRHMAGTSLCAGARESP